MAHDASTVDRGGDDLRALLGAALARIEQLEVEMAELRTDLGPSEMSVRSSVASPASDGSGRTVGSGEMTGEVGSIEDVPGDGTVDRRRALKGAVLAAGAAAAGLVLGDAQPAAANTGDTLVLGSQLQGCNSATAFAVTGTTAGLGLGVVDNSRASYGVLPAVSGHARGSNFNVGVEGFGEAANVGVQGQTANGIGVNGTATGASGTGVVGLGGDTGVFGSGAGYGVMGLSENGYALWAQSTSFVGLYVDGWTNHLHFGGNGTREAPTTDAFTHTPGDVVMDKSGQLWLCTTQGTPGTWRKLAGPATAGSLHVLPTPARVYDSRPGTSPSQGPKTKLTGNVARTIDCTVNSSGVPADATAVAFTVLLVNAFNGNGNMTIWANGASRPSANTMVWGTGSGRYTSSTISATGTGAKVQVSASASTDVVLDIVGYYR